MAAPSPNQHAVAAVSLATAVQFMVLLNGGVFCLKMEELNMKECGLVRISADGFGHEDVVAGNLDRHIRSERCSASFEVAEVAIKGRKGSAGADDA